MKLRPSFPEIPTDNPFANCKLEREPFAKILTSVIDCAEGGFTMALNGSWGTGKTTFVRMWQKYLEKAGYKTAYINAWEMDFATNPLVSILGEVGSPTGKDRRKPYSNSALNFKISLKSIAEESRWYFSLTN